MHPILQALTAAGVNWLMTALGAAGIFLAPGMSRKAVDAMLGFAAGVMLAALLLGDGALAPQMGHARDPPAS